MEGSGIFISPSEVLEGSGSVGLCLLLWVIGGVLTLCGKYCLKLLYSDNNVLMLA